ETWIFTAQGNAAPLRRIAGVETRRRFESGGRVMHGWGTLTSNDADDRIALQCRRIEQRSALWVRRCSGIAPVSGAPVYSQRSHGSKSFTRVADVARGVRSHHGASNGYL